HGVDEPAVVLGDAAVLSGSAGQQVLDPVPVGVRARVAREHRRPSVATNTARRLPKPPASCPYDLSELIPARSASKGRTFGPCWRCGLVKPTSPVVQVFLSSAAFSAHSGNSGQSANSGKPISLAGTEAPPPRIGDGGC